MTETPFDAEAWIGRLAAALEALAATFEYSLSLDGGPSRYVRYDEVQALKAEGNRLDALRDAVMAGSVSFNPERFDSDQAELRAILREHPELRRVSKGTGSDVSLMILNPLGASLVSSRELVLHLMRLSVASTGTEVARLLHRFLTDGESRQLEAREFVVLYGLKLARRIDLGSGAFLAPLDDRLISQEGLTEREAEQLKTYGAAGRNFQKDSGGSSVFVRDLHWGPGVARAPDEPRPDPDKIDSAEVTYRFPCDVETVANLLSIAARCPLATSARHVRFAQWMHDVDRQFAVGQWHFARYRFDGWWEERELSSKAEADFKQLITKWPQFQFASESKRIAKLERDALSLAAWRLSGSFARIGRWQLHDRILDYAIALEILYRLDSSELTYKLGTRAAFLLGEKPQDRKSAFKKIADFYDIRSAIVHGPTKRKHRDLRYEDFERACADGCDLACATLLALLQRGRFPDWNALVLEESVAPAART